MMPQRLGLKVLIAQINTTVGDFEGNLKKIRLALKAAKQARAKLVTFPELTLTGYPPEDVLLKEHFVDDNHKAFRSLLPFTKGLMAVVGFVDRDAKKNIYNAAAFIVDGKVRYIYRKIHLPNYGVFDEKRYFTPGNSAAILDLGRFSLGLTICEDIWPADSFVYQKSFTGKISLLVNISCSPYHLNKQIERKKLIKKLAIKTRCTVIYHNLVGGQDELVFDGGSLVVDQGGWILAEAVGFEEQLLIADAPLALVPPKSLRSSNLKILPIKIPHSFLGRFSKKSYPKQTLLSQEEEVYKALVLGTRDYILKNRFKKVLIGLSGGIDSAIVACIAVDALGAQNVLGVTMPSPYTSKETYGDAKLLAKNLSIECLDIGIEVILNQYLAVLKRPFSGHPVDTTEENLQARIRGNILMALSNKFGYLVLATGNKSEMATGYCTLYGDMAGGFAVIKDVPKTMVFKLAAYKNRAGVGIIPQTIIQRPPTAELRHDQKDQDTLPPYSVLDKFLEAYVEKDGSIKQIVKQGISMALARKTARMVDRNEYKRRQAPPGIKITPKAFGRDRRMPITNHYST